MALGQFHRSSPHMAHIWIAIGLIALLAPCTAASGRGEALDRVSSVAEKQRYVDELLELVGIASISALPSHRPDVERAAAWVVQRLTRAGLENIKTLPVDGDPRPVVYADYVHNPGMPTALLYAHYDVQPAEPLDLWASPPFQPAVRGGKVYGRGASDNKGGLLAVVQALEAVLQTNKALPLNIKLLFEGSEEVGSPRLGEFVQTHKKLLACDFAISADGRQISEAQPGILLGLRGAVALEVGISALKTDVHSGQAGGAVQNPLRAMSQLLSSMYHKNGSVAVAGFYDRVRPITSQDKDDMLAYNFDEEQELLRPLGAVESYGEDSFTTLERIWFRPTLEIVGLSGGFAGDGIKTIIPSRAVAKLAARLVPDQDPADVLALVEAHIQAHHPPACNVTVQELGFKGSPYLGARDSPVNAAASKVLAESMGVRPLYFKDGATIPAMAIFQQHLGVDTLGFGFELASDNLHAPNEHMQLSLYHLAREAFIKLFYELRGVALAHDKAEL